eukprot:TRINITY_DN18332_c0_g1_i4.p1 TRINITY_DN18332_c0_g1~~TRINITY_DN18332_c0_g1_i4.p1  ORF type:complete len:547 (-),score=158.80 TRINITY_DN18332_c0_g1_i4:338-1978(-)
MAKRSAAQAKGASEMARLDKNRDGVVSEPEFVSGGGSAEEFRQYDTNHDGTLDGREMEARAADMVDKQEEENATALKGQHEMERMDTNKDGGVDRQEFVSAGGTDVEFDRYDTNEDGKLDGREMAKRSAAQAKGASEMARLDENRDGVVSEPEFVSGGGSAEEFRQYDTNHDGTLDGREMEARAADMVDKQEEENATALKGQHDMERMDTNKDGGVDRQEFVSAGGTDVEFDRYDTNEDGKLDGREMAKRSAAQAKGASEMARLDKNRDGVVSEPEFVSGGGSAEEFRQYDTNHDGTLDGREMEARAADMVDKQEEENATADMVDACDGGESLGVRRQLSPRSLQRELEATRKTLNRLAREHENVHRDLMQTRSLLNQDPVPAKSPSPYSPSPSPTTYSDLFPNPNQDWIDAEFDRLDVNKDGVIDRDEFAQFQFPHTVVAMSPTGLSQPDLVRLASRLEGLATFWEVSAKSYMSRSGSSRVDSLSVLEVEQVAAELESLSTPYGYGKPGATYAQEIPGEEVFRDVVRMKVARIQTQLKKLLHVTQ